MLAWLLRLFPGGELEIVAVDRRRLTACRPALVHAMDAGPAELEARARLAVEAYWRRRGVHFLAATVAGLDSGRRQVHLLEAPPLAYDVCFVATGSEPGWDSIPGLGPEQGGICEPHLARHTARLNGEWRGGRFVFAAGPVAGGFAWDPPLAVVCECPLLESALLFDHHLRRIGRRRESSLTVVTPGPVPAADTGPRTRARVAALLAARGIRVVTGARYRAVTGRAILLEGQRVPYDRAVWIPPYAGSAWARASGIADGAG